MCARWTNMTCPLWEQLAWEFSNELGFPSSSRKCAALLAEPWWRLTSGQRDALLPLEVPEQIIASSEFQRFAKARPQIEQKQLDAQIARLEVFLKQLRGHIP